MLFYSMTACTTQRVACPLPVQVESVRIWSFTVGTAPVHHRQGNAFVNEGFFDRFIGKRTVIRGSVKRCLIGCVDAVRMGSACIGHIYLRMCLQEILFL